MTRADPTFPAPDLRPLGPDGLLVRFADRIDDAANRAAIAFRAEVEAAGIAGVTEAAASLTSVYLRFRPDQLSRAILTETVKELLGARDWRKAPLPHGRKLWILPVAFGGAHGPELADTARAAGLDPEAAVAEITAARLRVLALGFAPGQPYLGFLPQHWDIPRRSEVTAEVPQGALVVAVRQVIPFASAAPTGWRQIGRTPFRCFDPARETPIPLAAGDEVAFREIDAAEFEGLARDPLGGATAETLP